VAEQIDRNAAGEVEIAFSAFADQVHALALDRSHFAPRINGHERRDGHVQSFDLKRDALCPSPRLDHRDIRPRPAQGKEKGAPNRNPERLV
jgi:hypothetical protein